MSSSDLYGLPGDDLEAARAAVQKALGISLELNATGKLGVDYYYWPDPEGVWEVTLRRNVAANFQEAVDAPEAQFAEPDFRDAKVLLEIDWHPQPDQIRAVLAAKIPGIRLLRRE